MKIYNIAGWIGVILILIAYILVSLQIINPNNLLYIILNIIGSCGILASSLKKKDFQPVALNIVWILVALIALVNLFI